MEMNRRDIFKLLGASAVVGAIPACAYMQHQHVMSAAWQEAVRDGWLVQVDLFHRIPRRGCCP